MPFIHDMCRFMQSIPMGMNISTDIETHVALIQLLDNAVSSVDFGVFYFALTGGALRFY